MPRPPRREREIRETRQHMLRAAARVFSRKGFAPASMQDIGREAGYSAPSLYSYFRGKQDIVNALAETITKEAQDLFGVSLPAGLTFRQQLELLLRHQNAWAETHRDAFLFFLQRGAPPSKDAEPPPDLAAHYIAQLTLWIEGRRAEGDLGSVGPTVASEVAANALWGLTHAFFLRWTRSGCAGSLNDSLAQVLDLFFYGLAGAPSKAG
ncbi:MAG: TetR/AcrR family transcriptional regulator [Proteobacteria bacterium]|nr:TetR/AcrR family transcriptional regulator [Pseudomonadota bacterium]